MLLGDVVDQLHDDHGLADPGAAEQPDLAALRIGGEEVDHLDPGLEHLLRRCEVLDLRRRAVDRPALLTLDLLPLVDRLAEQVEDAAEGGLAHGDRDRPPGVQDLVAPLQPVGGVHRDSANPVVAQMLLDLADELPALAAVTVPQLDPERRVDLGQLVGEDRIDDDARHLLDATNVSVLSH
jgi:hypothetical protein